MNRSPAIWVPVSIATLAVGLCLADEADMERVGIKVRATVDAPGLNATVSTTVMSGADEGSEYILPMEDFGIRVVVVDSGKFEYVVRVDLMDSDGAVLDSRSVFASLSDPGDFEMSSGDVSAHGRIEVKDRIGQH